MRAILLPSAIILTKAHKDGQGKYCGLSTASEVFLDFTTQIFISVLLQSNIDNREVLHQEYSQPPILPSPHLRWVGNHE